MKSNTIILIVVTLLIAAGAYYWYSSTQTGNETPLTEVTTKENQAQTRFQTLLGELPIKFDTSIFEKSNFTALVDLATPVTDETKGRPDPFAPVLGISEK